MPFGLTNHLVPLVDFMNMIFRSYLDKFVVIFINDILIYSKNKEDRANQLRGTLTSLREHQLYDKLKKCELCLTEVAFLE